MVDATTPTAGAQGRRFYVFMAFICAAIAFGLFSLTYWGPLLAGQFRAAPAVHVHAIVFSAWVLMLLAQSGLVATGRLRHHRAWGLAGVSLATAMVFVGLWAALQRVVVDIERGFADASFAFAIIPIAGIALFAALMSFAFANVHRPEIHKRLVLVATIGILQAAVGRLFFVLLRPSPAIVHPSEGPPMPPAFTLSSAVVVDLLILAAIIYDWRTRGRPHPAYLIAGAATVAVQVLSVQLSGTAAWRATIEWLVHVATGG